MNNDFYNDYVEMMNLCEKHLKNDMGDVLFFNDMKCNYKVIEITPFSLYLSVKLEITAINFDYKTEGLRRIKWEELW